MSGSVNKVILIGRLGADPETREVGSNTVANLRVATSERWRDKSSGEQKERTEWHSVTIWGKTAEIAARYLRKGSCVYLEGQLQTRKWQDKDGNDRYSTEVVLQGFNSTLTMLDGKSDSAETYSDAAHQVRNKSGGSDFSRDLEDEIPF